eukprot:6095497-Amphidinium_carterae.1
MMRLRTSPVAARSQINPIKMAVRRQPVEDCGLSDDERRSRRRVITSPRDPRYSEATLSTNISNEGPSPTPVTPGQQCDGLLQPMWLVWMFWLSTTRLPRMAAVARLGHGDLCGNRP